MTMTDQSNANHRAPSLSGDLQTPPMSGAKYHRYRYSDTVAPSSSRIFVDPAEFPCLDVWETAEVRARQQKLSFPQCGKFGGRPTTAAPQRHFSFTSGGGGGGGSSSGFESDLSSNATGCNTCSRQPSFTFNNSASDSMGELHWPPCADVWASLAGHQQQSTQHQPTLFHQQRHHQATTMTDSFKHFDIGRQSEASVDVVRQRSGSCAVASARPACGVTRSFSVNLASLPNFGKQQQPSSKGNIFRQRKDFSVFQNLHPSKKNGYFIQLEDDSCTGNEDTRAFLLCQLTNHGASELQCIACRKSMPVYDHFPVVDGALFLSPISHRGGLQVCWNSPAPSANQSTSSTSSPGPPAGRLMSSPLAPPPGCTGPRQQQSIPSGGGGGGGGFHSRGVGSHHHHPHSNHHHHQRRSGAPISQEKFLHAICMSCMASTTSSTDAEGQDMSSQIVCKFCNQVWKGSTLLIGAMYTYDPFASAPCCFEHLKCKSCGRQALPNQSYQSQSQKASSSSLKASTACVGSIVISCEKSVSDVGTANPPLNLLPLPYFSQYSQKMCCQHCRVVDYHFIKPFDDMYNVCLPT